MADDLGGMGDLVVDDIVGHRQQGSDEDLVARRAFGQPRVAVECRAGQMLGIEAALGAGRYDHRILDQLRLHEAEDFGAEIVAPVGPAKSAAGDRPAAQMDALDTRRIDPDFAIWDRRWKAGHLFGIDLERQRFFRRGGEGVGAQRRPDHRSHQAQDAVIVDAPDIFQRVVECVGRDQRLGLALALETGVVERAEQADQRLGGDRRTAQCIDYRDERVSNTDLAGVAEPGAQPDHRFGAESGADDQLVERVILGLAAKH